MVTNPIKKLFSLPHSPDEDYRRLAEREGTLWGKEKGEERLTWFDSPLIARTINRRISGSSDCDWLDYVKNKFFRIPAPKALNVGCGQGELERLLLKRDIVERVDGFDISAGAVAIAGEKAEKAGFADRVRYRVADANRLDTASLDSNYDAVFISMALHHFMELEHCLDELKKRLRPGGYLIANEFVGPDRFQWTDTQLRAANRLLQRFPHELKINLREPERIKQSIERPTLEYMKNYLAFEAVCSERIIPALRERFEILELREYGGTVLQLLFEAIMGNFDEEHNREHAVIVQMAAACEDLLLENGAIAHDHALIICKA